MDTLLEKVKANLILEHSADDALLQSYITAAVSYAESYQHIQEGYYTENAMPATTEQAVIMLASHFYVPRAAFSRTMCRPASRSGTRSTFCFGSTETGAFSASGGPQKAVWLFGERRSNGMSELFVLARKRAIWSL